MLNQGDQDNTVQVIFLQKHVCVLKANIAEVIFLCNVASDVFGQDRVYSYAMFFQPDRHNIV